MNAPNAPRYRQPDHQHDDAGDHHLRRALDAVVDTQRDDADRGSHEQAVKEDGLGSGRDGPEVLPGGTEVRALGAADDVLAHPPADDAVVGDDPEADERPEPTKVSPPGVAELRERVDGVGLGLAPDHELREQRRHADPDDRDQIDDQKHGAAVGRSLERELPDVAQPDCAADRRDQKAHAGGPRRSLTHQYRSLPPGGL